MAQNLCLKDDHFCGLKKKLWRLNTTSPNNATKNKRFFYFQLMNYSEQL